MAVDSTLTLQAERESVGSSLMEALAAVIESVSDKPVNVSALGRKLGLNRVTVSKLMSSLASETPDEMLATIPGPESLRSAVEAAAEHGTDESTIESAREAIDLFAGLIRDQYGTRAALNAALGTESQKLSEREAVNSRGEVFNGMRRIIGVEAAVWLNAMFFVPSEEDDAVIATTTLHGAYGIRRLRMDTPFYFVFGTPFYEPGRDGSDLATEPMQLDDFYTNEPAVLESTKMGSQICHRLVHDKLGKNAVVDMLTVSIDRKGSRRYAAPESPLRGMSLVMDLPVRSLVFDVILHESLYPGSDAELFVFKPGARGPSNPNDPSSARDRVPTPERIEAFPGERETFEVPDVPRYGEMIQRMCTALNRPISEFRVHRLTMAYPLTGFQYTMAFRAPLPPE